MKRVALQKNFTRVERRQRGGEKISIFPVKFERISRALRKDWRRDGAVSWHGSIDFLISAPFSRSIDEIKKKGERERERMRREKGRRRGGKIGKKNERRQQRGSVVAGWNFLSKFPRRINARQIKPKFLLRPANFVKPLCKFLSSRCSSLLRPV